MLQFTSPPFDVATGIACRARAVAVQMASVSASVDSYYGYWFSHWRA
ncbi:MULTISPECIES: hypothetical protein [Pseudomonas]|nr:MULTISPECIES: hypothetical protein [Pseudomonas]MCA5967750.1 hypothetical protein [Pseudomonas sp. P129]MCH5487774.1 hypothetical protein [Pseudomonas syringae pv. syringae]MDF5890200.1 hypothetical protein [Pseudomonas syringae pv. syringae]MDO1458917.1 hypothetical protein [Pseudomonas syringae pv. syringae]